MSTPQGPWGRYVIESDLGHGGMGVVHVALDTQLQRRVALKVVSPQLAGSEEFRERFHREAATLARLDSPHVIAIYDHGEQDGRPYLATQLVRGGDLGSLITQRGPLPPSAAVTVCGQVADALADAHDVGVVHRDIKASNVLVRDPDNERLHVYLCDFGIAVDETSDRLTTAGAVVGTWAYLAPERTEGLPATPASDLYALGCLLWVCLTGETPYSGTDVRVAMAHVSSPVRQLADTGPQARHLNEVLARTMAKDPAQRYPSAAALRAALEATPPAVGAIEPLPLPGAWTPPPATSVSARPLSSPSPPPSSPSPMAPPAGRRPTGGRRRGVVAAVAALVLVAVVVGGAVWATSGDDGGDEADDPPTTSPVTSPVTSPTTSPTTEPTTPTADPGLGTDASVGADLDGDGLGDAFMTFQDGAAASPLMFRYLSDGQTFAIEEPGDVDASFPAFVDLDGDGVHTLLTTVVSPEGLTIETAEAGLGGTTYAGITVQDDIGFVDVLSGDVDGNGDKDLVIWGQSGAREVTVWVLLQDDGALADPQPWLVLPEAHVYAMTLSLADHDRDGRADLLAVLPTGVVEFDGPSTFYDGERGARLYPSSGTAFDDVNPLVPDAILQSSFQVVGDFGGDGVPLLAVADTDAAGISFFRATASGLVEDTGRHLDLPTTPEGRAPRFTASDVDGDGDDDLVLVPRTAARAYGEVEVALASGDVMAEPETWAAPPPPCTDDVCIVAWAFVL